VVRTNASHLSRATATLCSDIGRQEVVGELEVGHPCEQRTLADMAAVDLYWLPLGAGGHFVRLNGRLYEALAARCSGGRRATFTTPGFRSKSHRERS
jgi:hypothetical protein